MNRAILTRYAYTDGRRQMFAIWLRLQQAQVELFHGPVGHYRAIGWERHLTQLMIDSMRLALTLAGWEVSGNA